MTDDLGMPLPRYHVRMVSAGVRLCADTPGRDITYAAVVLMAEDYCWPASKAHELARRAMEAEWSESSIKPPAAFSRISQWFHKTNVSHGYGKFLP